MKAINKRLLFSFLLIMSVPVLIAFRLVHLQVLRHRFYSNRAERQVTGSRSIPVSRGEIRDRNNRVLAMNVEVNSLAINPRVVVDRRSTARKLAAHLGMNPGLLERKLSRESYFVWLKRRLEDSTAEEIRALGIEGLDFRKETKRFYPMGRMACHLVGAVGLDGGGLSGVELLCNDVLIRKGISRKFRKDGLCREVDVSAVNKSDKIDVVLTVDSTLQYIAQKELETIKRNFDPKRAFVIIQEPFTGEILTLACIPEFDQAADSFKLKKLNNPAVNRVFEPGSVFKIVPAVALVEEGLCRPSDLFYCENGKFKLTEGITIHDHEKHGYLTFDGIMAHSSNIGFAKAGIKLGDSRIYTWTRKFGFGSHTGSRLPGEQRGIVIPPRSRRWNRVTGPIMCYGQGMAATGIQLVNMFSAVANGGLLMEPKTVKAFVNGENETVWHYKPHVVRRVMNPESAEIIRKMLTDVVEYGTGRRAGIQGYAVAGKTGTAQKIDPDTRKYSDELHIASFGGFIPADDPKLTILVVVDEPHKTFWASEVACPAFASIAEQAINYWNIKENNRKYYASAE